MCRAGSHIVYLSHEYEITSMARCKEHWLMKMQGFLANSCVAKPSGNELSFSSHAQDVVLQGFLWGRQGVRDCREPGER